jgi:twitching motility protein PilT
MACELMIPNPAIRNLIREEKVHQLYSQMQVGQQKWGMVTLSQALLDLVQRRLISPDAALEAATEPEELRNMLGAKGPTGGPAARMSLAK